MQGEETGLPRLPPNMGILKLLHGRDKPGRDPQLSEMSLGFRVSGCQYINEDYRILTSRIYGKLPNKHHGNPKP